MELKKRQKGQKKTLKNDRKAKIKENFRQLKRKFRGCQKVRDA